MYLSIEKFAAPFFSRLADVIDTTMNKIIAFQSHTNCDIVANIIHTNAYKYKAQITTCVNVLTFFFRFHSLLHFWLSEYYIEFDSTQKLHPKNNNGKKIAFFFHPLALICFLFCVVFERNIHMLLHKTTNSMISLINRMPLSISYVK